MYPGGATDNLISSGLVMVCLACIVGMANIIASFDGITWYNAGYCEGAKNDMICGLMTLQPNVA